MTPINRYTSSTMVCAVGPAAVITVDTGKTTATSPADGAKPVRPSTWRLRALNPGASGHDE
jgi:hypothetical protein